MPTKKKSFLIDTSEFEKTIQSNNPQELEKNLMELMNLANTYYDTVYRKFKNNPDREKFSFCKQNFSQIKSIIESKTNFTPSINEFYIEAWISTLYSEVHALNLEPETEKQLNELSKKIQTIGTEFKQLLTKKSSLDSKNEMSVNLLKYIANFEHTWKAHEKRLLADSTFNFAEILIEQSNFQQALYHFERAKSLYDEATANTTDNCDKMQLKKFSAQTSARLKKIKSTHLEDYSNNLGNELRIHLQRLPDSITNWKIVNESSPTESTKEKQEIKSFIENDSLSSKIKRKSNEEPIDLETKKPKKDPSIGCPKKIKFRWKIECEQLLKKLEEITKENYKLPSSLPNQLELIRYKASLASQDAIKVIEKLIFTNEKLDDIKKLDYLKEAERAFQYSISFYNQAGLIREKGKVIHCQNSLISTINEFKNSIYTEKFPIKSKVISRASKVSLFKPTNLNVEVCQPNPSKSNDSLLINTEKRQTETLISLEEKLREFQHPYLTRYVQNFLSGNSLEQNSNDQQNLKIVCP